MSDDEYEQLAGIYEGYGCKAEVAQQNGEKFFIWNDREVNPFYPITATRFHHTLYQLEYPFKQNGDGEWTFLGMKKTTLQ
ncbi:hypothetical protein ACFQZE_03185 [Paenibacillus sp. GCM10027627]